MTTRTSLYTTRMHVPCLGRGYTLHRLLTNSAAHWESEEVNPNRVRQDWTMKEKKCLGCGGSGSVLHPTKYKDEADWLGL